MRPEFERVGNLENFPVNERWVCSYELAKQRTDLVPMNKSKKLEALLKHFKL